MVRKRAIVTGRVQGVGFRWSAREEARRLGVTGWARNRRDGSVEVEVEGPEETVERMLDWLRAGPPGSEVATIEVTGVEDAAERATGEDAFRIRETV